MAFGNKLGVKIEHNLSPDDLFAPDFGSIVAEVPDGKVGELAITYTVIGEVTDNGTFAYRSVCIPADEAVDAWKGTLERIFHTRSSEAEIFSKSIRDAQIIMFPGGFSAGDEPDGSAKFFATAFRNEKIREAVDDLLENRDGLVLGICNGFQALIKLGLVPYGKIQDQQMADSPTLTFNTIHRHISKMVYTQVMSNNSPWLAGAEVGRTYVNPASHGEGRFVANEDWIYRLIHNGQVATMYADADGKLTMDEEWNVNGSYAGIEGILSPDGRVLGKMCHCERRGDGVAINIYGEQDMKIFESGVGYFK